MDEPADESCVRFAPPEVRGMPAVTEVAVFSDRLEVQAGRRWVAFAYRTFARRQESIVSSWLKRVFGRRPYKKVVGEREFCTSRRYVLFYTDPRLKIYTPPDSDSDGYGSTYIGRINAVLSKSSYSTYDLS